jgi:hypothetical protein
MVSAVVRLPYLLRERPDTIPEREHRHQEERSDDRERVRVPWQQARGIYTGVLPIRAGGCFLLGSLHLAICSVFYNLHRKFMNTLVIL